MPVFLNHIQAEYALVSALRLMERSILKHLVSNGPPICDSAIDKPDDSVSILSHQKALRKYIQTFL